jgi:hypothetical protein
MEPFVTFTVGIKNRAPSGTKGRGWKINSARNAQCNLAN